MAITLTEVNGLAAADASLKQSKRSFKMEQYQEVMKLIYNHSDYRGFILPPSNDPGRNTQGYQDEHNKIVDILNKLAKWGAGVGQEDNGTWIDAGHETLLRYIDLTFVVEALHRGGTDDLDSHAMRFNNRIVRSSTRLATYDQSERSPWYKGKILSVEEVANGLGIDLPNEFTDLEGTTWVKSANGYVNKHFEGNHDVMRGNYPLSIPMSAIMKINLFDLRHVYKRRNAYTHAAPELRMYIEGLADQVEAAIPGDLGKLVRYDYAYNPNTGKNELSHIMSIRKTVDTSRVDVPILYD